MNKKLTKTDLIKEIKRQYEKHKHFFDFVGWTENKELSREVESYFNYGGKGYDWVNGNNKLKELIKEVIEKEKYKELSRKVESYFKKNKKEVI